jgi:hypothetical protein
MVALATAETVRTHANCGLLAIARRGIFSWDQLHANNVSKSFSDQVIREVQENIRLYNVKATKIIDSIR